MAVMNGKMKLYDDGTKKWELNGVLHRLDGPAVDWANGRAKWWYINGTCHRLDGPAIEYSNGRKIWYANGILHRLDGPALEREDGSKEWWVNNIRLSSSEINQWVKDNNLSIPFNEETQVLFKLRWL